MSSAGLNFVGISDILKGKKHEPEMLQICRNCGLIREGFGGDWSNPPFVEVLPSTKAAEHHDFCVFTNVLCGGDTVDFYIWGNGNKR
jgi:hypothetical protein